MNEPIAVDARSKRTVCGRSFAMIVGSNHTGGMDFCSHECCVLSGKCVSVVLITGPEESYGLCYV